MASCVGDAWLSECCSMRLIWIMAVLIISITANNMPCHCDNTSTWYMMYDISLWLALTMVRQQHKTRKDTHSENGEGGAETDKKRVARTQSSGRTSDWCGKRLHACKKFPMKRTFHMWHGRNPTPCGQCQVVKTNNPINKSSSSHNRYSNVAYLWITSRNEKTWRDHHR